jgi:hypothetical protein
MHKNVDWEPYLQIADREHLSPAERLRAYATIADARLDTERFHEFSAAHLGHLDEVAWEFFGTPEARVAVRAKVESLFPLDEIEEFTELFWLRIQQWREDAAAGRQAAPREVS